MPKVELTSPDGRLHATIATDAGGVHYRVNGITGRIGLTLDDRTYGGPGTAITDRVVRSETSDRFPIRGGHAEAFDHATVAQLTLISPGNVRCTLECRVADDAFAFRLKMLQRGQVAAELTSFTLPAESACWYFERDSSWKLKSHAGEWRRGPLAQMVSVSKQGPVQGLPLVFELPDGEYAFISEAQLIEYSGLRLRAVDATTFVADLADGEGFLTTNNVITPWRVIGFARDLNELANHDAIACCCPRGDLAAAPRPGRSVWRWWSSGTGTPDEERAYVDHARALGFEYTTVDDGWAKWPDAWAGLKRVCRHARMADVGVIAWVHHDEIADPADGYAKMAAYIDRAADAGVRGLKVDFLNSESVERVRFVVACLKIAAGRNLLINFHGIGKPTGEAVMFPNELTREAIRGLELNRMKEGPITPSHNAALPFTRLIVGHGDYTPLTVTRERLGPTTLAHQAATWVAFTSPLQTLAEDPKKLLDDAAMRPIVDLLRACPTTFDETRVLPGSKIGDLAVLARRKGDRWWIVALNGGARRTYRLAFDFIGDGKLAGELISDDVADRPAFAAKAVEVTKDQTLEIELDAGGGFVCSLWPAGGER